ncbi:MAG: hypothetical protein HY558_05635 [Euryarchaeota archaeon]|nr:hypothetical protein [Euryarchaeota archaeon]
MLTDLQWRIWWLRRVGGAGYSDIARHLEMARQDVYNVEKAVERKLRRAAREGEEARELLEPRIQPRLDERLFRQSVNPRLFLPRKS